MKFLQNTAENKPFYALTTDNLSIYKSTADESRVIHQQYIFHLFEMINDRIYKISKSRDVCRQDKICLIPYATEIKNIARITKTQQ